MKLYLIRFTDTVGNSRSAQVPAGSEEMAVKKLRRRENVDDVYSIQCISNRFTNNDD